MSSLQAPCSMGELWKVLEFRSGKIIAVPKEDLPCVQDQKEPEVRKTKDTSVQSEG